VDLTVVSIQTAFVAKAGVFAIWDWADVRLAMFSFMLSEMC
jgi:hypothetical protein